MSEMSNEMAQGFKIARSIFWDSISIGKPMILVARIGSQMLQQVTRGSIMLQENEEMLKLLKNEQSLLTLLLHV